MKFFLYENLLSERFKEYIVHKAHEQTYADIFKSLKLEGDFLVLENDIVKKYPACAGEKPPKESIISIKRIPRGDANTVSYILGGVLVAAGVVLSVVGYGVGVPLIIAGAGMIVGTAIAQIYAGQNVPDQKDAPQGKEQYGLQGARNRIALGSKYPVIFGKHVITPPLVGTYYTELSDNNGRGDQYLSAMLCLGYAPLSVKNIQLGLNPLASNSADVRNGFINIDGNYVGQLEVRQDGTYPSLYPWKKTEEQLNAEIILPINMTTLEGIDTRVTSRKTKSISCIILFNGLYSMQDSGNFVNNTVRVGLAFRKRSASVWTFPVYRDFTFATADTLRFTLSHTFTSAELAANPDGDWEVAIFRTTAPSEIVKVRDKVYWMTLRANIDNRPVAEAELQKMCVLAFRIKATEAANGVLDQLNAICTSILPIYDKTLGLSGLDAWTQTQPTSNPAACYLAALRGKYLPEQAAPESIDFPALEALYIWCENNEYYCDGVISNGEPLRNILNKILATCQASFYIKSGLYSLVRDVEQPCPIAILTPKNTRGFSASKSFQKLPKALDITYNDELNSYVPKNDLAILADESVEDGDLIEKISMWGVTGYDQIVKLGRYILAAARLRPEIFTVTVSIEHFGLPIGARVLLQHDVLTVGLAGGFVKNVDEMANTIQLDEFINLDADKEYAIEVFTTDGDMLYFTVINVETEFTDIIEVDGDLSDVETGAIYAFGETGKETLDCLVKHKQPNQSPDLSAEISLVSYSPEIFDAPTKPIPLYNPKTTVRGNYSVLVVNEDNRQGRPNNGNTVQDDGGVYFDFQHASFQGNALLNMGSLKEISDAVIRNVSVEVNARGNYAVGIPGTNVQFQVDTLLFQNSSIVFWIKDASANGIVYSYQDEQQLNVYKAIYADGILTVQIQGLAVQIPLDANSNDMISVVNDYTNQSVRVYKNTELIGSFELTANIIGEDLENIISEGSPDNIISEGLVSFGVPIRGVPFNLFGDGSLGSSFTGKIGFFRVYGWALGEGEINALYTNNKILLNTAEETRYLGEFEEQPLDINLYDVFTYTGITNDTFLNGKNYALVLGGWQIWELKYGR
jgi:hypothetical protein